MARFIHTVELVIAAAALGTGICSGAPVDPEPQREFERTTTCGKDAQHFKPTPFDPACYVRIFEDAGNNRRYVLYSYDDPRSFTRQLKVDPGSKLIIDLAHGLNANQDVGLNQFSVRAEMTNENGTTPIEVVGYSEVGVSEEERAAQRAFGLQTFTNLSSSMFTLYYTLKEFVVGLERDGEVACVNHILKGKAEATDTVTQIMTSAECRTLRLLEPTGSEEALNKEIADTATRISQARAERTKLQTQIDALRNELALRRLIVNPECAPSTSDRTGSRNCGPAALIQMEFDRAEAQLKQWLAAQGAQDQRIAAAEMEQKNVQSQIATLNVEQLDSEERIQRFDTMVKRHGEKLKGIADFFVSPENKTVAAGVAAHVFHVDEDTMRLIARTVKERIEKLQGDELTGQARAEQRRLLLYNIAALLHSLRYVHGEITEIASTQAKDIKTVRQLYGHAEGCPEALLGPPVFSPTRVAQHNVFDFPQRCVSEVLRRSYVNSLHKYLVSGTIALPAYKVEAGDVITLTIEARGADKRSLGATARFYIEATRYGWKLSARDSLLFVKRLNVPERAINVTDTEADRTAGLKTIRFRPYPGFTLGSTYYHRGTKLFCDAEVPSRAALLAQASQADDLDRDKVLSRLDDPRTKVTGCRATEGAPGYYRAPSYSRMERFLRVLSPGFGLNATVMHWDDDDRFDPTTGTFGDGTTAKNFQLGVGPVVSLFGDRISAVYGWNLMAPRQRAYFGFGFSFIRFGQDLAGLFSK